MRRTVRFTGWLGLVALALAACGEGTQTPSPDAAGTTPEVTTVRPPMASFTLPNNGACPSSSVSERAVNDLLPQLFAPGNGRRGKAQNLSNDMIKQKKDGNISLANIKADSLLNFTLQQYYDGQLLNQNSDLAGTQQRIVDFFFYIYCFNGYSLSDLPDFDLLFSASNGVLIRNSSQTTVVTTEDAFAGVKVDAGDVPATVGGVPFFGTYVAVVKTTDTLPTNLDWYGIDGFKAGAFRFIATPEVTFQDPVTTSVCISYDDAVVTDPAELRLAHAVDPGYTSTVPGNVTFGQIELLQQVGQSVSGLVCDGQEIFIPSSAMGRVLRRAADFLLPERLLAAGTGGKISGATADFSPFAAVHTRLGLTSTGPSGTQYIPLGQTSITAPVTATVRTLNPAGLTPIAGIPVGFAPAASFAATPVLTGANGTATGIWTIVAGSNSATATPSLAPFSFTPASASYSVTAVQVTPVSITSTPPNGTVGVAYSHSFTATGGIGTPYTYAQASGTLPTGLTLSAGGALTGTPTAAGSFTFGVTATSGNAASGSVTSAPQSFTVVIGTPPVDVTTTSLPNAILGIAYSQQLAATGGDGTYAWNATGALPAGLSFSGSGQVSGTPTALGTSSFSVTATSDGKSDTQPLTITVVSPTGVTLTFDPGPSRSRCYAVNVPLSPTVRIRVRDGAGRPVSGVQVNLVAVTNNGAKKEVSQPFAISGTDGYANFNTLSINGTGGFSLIASTGSPWPTLSVTSGKFNISPSC